MVKRILYLFFLVIVFACEDSEPDPYGDIIGNYHGLQYSVSNHMDLPTWTWTTVYDTIEFSFNIKRVIDEGNDHVKLDTDGGSLFYYGGTKELFSRDTIELQAYWGYVQERLAIFRKQNKIELRSHTGNPGGLPDYSDTSFLGIKE